MRVTITKQVGHNETLTVEEDLTTPAQWVSRVAPVFDYIDARLIDLNKRVLKANEELKKLDAETYERVRNILFLVAGVQIPPGGGRLDESDEGAQ